MLCDIACKYGISRCKSALNSSTIKIKFDGASIYNLCCCNSVAQFDTMPTVIFVDSGEISRSKVISN